MDELLVNWLSSDGVYESILTLVESHRSSAVSNSSPTSGSTSPNRGQKDDGTPSAVSKESSALAQTIPVASTEISDTLGGSPRSESRKREKNDASLPPHPKSLSPGDQRSDGSLSPRTVHSFDIPPFYNPNEGGRGRGRKPSPEDQSWNAIEQNSILKQVFTTGAHSQGSDNSKLPNDDPSLILSLSEFVPITKEVCNFPSFFNAPLYRRILELSKEDAENTGGEVDLRSNGVSYSMFEKFWKSEMQLWDAHDRFFRLVKKPDEEYITRDDFLPFIEELLASHPGLEFLSNHSEFQEKYAVTVITRIFYCVNRYGHNGKITARQIRRSNLLEAFHLVDTEEDINKVTQYFSYEHFYVLYCRFWELDHDRDYLITREDLLKYGDHSLSHMIVDRIFDAAPRPFDSSSIVNASNTQGGNGQATNTANGAHPTSVEYLSYEDFIFFMLSEEDKANEVSVRYWFTCIDVDGDGKLNNMEMRSFYAVQLHRMQCLGHEIVPFEDMLCQMIDMIKPANQDYLVVEDFLQVECAQVSGALFDALFNLNKYLQFEQRDPFMERQKREDEFENDWDRFACIDYNRLAMEEEAREEEAMEIDWVTADDDDDDGDDFNSLGLGGASEAPF